MFPFGPGKKMYSDNSPTKGGRMTDETAVPVALATQSLAFWPIDKAIKRMVDLDRRSRDERPQFDLRLSKLQPDMARKLYANARNTIFADLVASSDDDRMAKSISIVHSATMFRSMAGLDGLLITSLGVLRSAGNTHDYEACLASLEAPTTLSAHQPFTLVYNPLTRVMQGLSFDAISSLVSPDSSISLRTDTDFGKAIEGAATAHAMNKEASTTCRDVFTYVGKTAGSILGGTVGGTFSGVGGAIAGGIGWYRKGAFGAAAAAATGAYIAGKAGGEAGSQAGAYAGEAVGAFLAGYFCGASTNPEPAPVQGDRGGLPVDNTPRGGPSEDDPNIKDPVVPTADAPSKNDPPKGENDTPKNDPPKADPPKADPPDNDPGDGGDDGGDIGDGIDDAAMGSGEDGPSDPEGGSFHNFMRAGAGAKIVRSMWFDPRAIDPVNPLIDDKRQVRVSLSALPQLVKVDSGYAVRMNGFSDAMQSLKSNALIKQAGLGQVDLRMGKKDQPFVVDRTKLTAEMLRHIGEGIGRHFEQNILNLWLD
jgi:hypothetical protein